MAFHRKATEAAVERPLWLKRRPAPVATRRLVVVVAVVAVVVVAVVVVAVVVVVVVVVPTLPTSTRSPDPGTLAGFLPLFLPSACSFFFKK